MEKLRLFGARAVLAIALVAGIVGHGAAPASGSTWSASGDVNFAGTAHLPMFPCTGTCAGTFEGTWSGHLSGHNETAAYTASWATAGTGLYASFTYRESLCGAPGSGALAGSANGSFTAVAYGSRAEAFGEWHQVGEVFPRAVIEVSMSGYFEWARVGNSAVVVVQPMWFNLYVSGLGWRQVSAVVQRGAATFAPTHSDAPPTGLVSCDNPLLNVQGEIDGNLPMTEPTV